MPLEDLSKDPMKWVNPCDGARVGNVPPNSNFNKTELKAIKDEADRDFNSALELTQNHIADTFKKPMEKVHQDFKDQKLEWLDMNLPKLLNETLEEGHFENKKIENVIPNVYSLLQRIAVGLEQITYDQKKSDSERVSKFEHLELEMKRLLCELQDFMAGHGHALPEDVQREIMKDEDRIGDDSTKRSRDYMILRDYMNTLQYVKMAFEYYHSIAP